MCALGERGAGVDELLRLAVVGMSLLYEGQSGDREYAPTAEPTAEPTRPPDCTIFAPAQLLSCYAISSFL